MATEADIRSSADVYKNTVAKLDLKMRKDFASGDQLGPGYIYYAGRKPTIGKDQSLREFELEQQDFAANVATDDVISDCLENICNATLGRDFEWTLKYTDSDLSSALLAPERRDEYEQLSPDDRAGVDALGQLETHGGAWHRRVGLQHIMWETQYTALWAGAAYLRLLIPQELSRQQIDFDAAFYKSLYGSKYVDANMDLLNPPLRPGSLPDIASALQRIQIEVHSPETIQPIKTGRTVRGYAVRYRVDNVTHYEVHTAQQITHYQDLGGSIKVVGDSYLNPFAAHNIANPADPMFLIIPVDRPRGSALSGDVISKQQRLNTTVTNGNRNDDLYGHRTAIITNADDLVEETPQGEEKAVSWRIHPRMISMVRGMPTSVDIDGDPLGYTTPGVHFIEPIDPDHNIKWADFWTRRIYRKFKQEHLLAQWQAVSGDSKKESRKSFDQEVIREGGYMGPAAGLTVITALKLAGHMARDDLSARVGKLECTPRLYLDVQKASLDTYKALSQARKDGHVSLETLVENNPAVTDAALELKRLAAEQEHGTEDLVQLRLLYQALIDAHRNGYATLDTVVKNNPALDPEDVEKELAAIRAEQAKRAAEIQAEIDRRVSQSLAGDNA